jgi:hypothetical protein
MFSIPSAVSIALSDIGQRNGDEGIFKADPPASEFRRGQKQKSQNQKLKRWPHGVIASHSTGRGNQQKSAAISG